MKFIAKFVINNTTSSQFLCVFFPLALLIATTFSGFIVTIYASSKPWNYIILGASILLGAAGYYLHNLTQKRTLNLSLSEMYVLIFIILLSINTSFFSYTAYERTVDELLENPLNAYNISRAGLLVLGMLIVIPVLLNRPNQKYVLKNVNSIYVLFGLLAFISFAWSPNPLTTIGKSFELFSFGLIMYAISSQIISSQPEKALYFIKKIWDFILIILFIRLCLLLAGALSNPRIGFRSGIGIVPQLWGNFGSIHPNTSGFLGLVFISIALFRLANVKKLFRDSKPTFFLYLIMGMVIMFFAQSRTAITWLPASLLLIGLMSKNKIKGFLPFLILFLFLGLIVVVNPNTVFEYFRRGQTDEQLYSLTGRTSHWAVAFQFFKASPLFGYSYYAGTRIFLARSVTFNISNLDNTFLQVLFELGVIGVSIFIIYLGACFRNLIKNIRLVNNKIYSEMGKELLLVLILIFLRSFTNPTIHILDYGSIFLVPIACFACIHLRNLKLHENITYPLRISTH